MILPRLCAAGILFLSILWFHTTDIWPQALAFGLCGIAIASLSYRKVKP